MCSISVSPLTASVVEKGTDWELKLSMEQHKPQDGVIFLTCVTFCQEIENQLASLQNRRHFVFAFFRQDEKSIRRARSNHARREGHKK